MKKQKNKNILRTLWNKIPLVRVIKDIRSYIQWIRVIKEERDNPTSKFNTFGMDHSYFYVLYMYTNLPEEDIALPEKIKMMRLMEILSPVHRYLDEDLGFAGYIVPEFGQFYDANDQPSLTYGIIYRFAFEKLSIKWVISRLIVLAASIIALAYYI